MKKIIYIILIILIPQFVYAAGNGGSDESKSDYFKDAKKLVKRAGKLEKKEKLDKEIDEEIKKAEVEINLLKKRCARKNKQNCH